MRIDEPNTPDDTPDTEAELSAALDEGIEAATPEPAGEPPADAPEGEEPVAKEGEGEPEGDKPDEAKPDAAKDDKKDEPHEADTLGLKGKSNERFREMAEEIKTLAPLKEALEKAGIKDIAEIPRLTQNAKDGHDLVEMVKSTGASPDQFSKTLDYLGLVTAAASGDRKAAEQAFSVIEGEYKALAQVLGKEIEGIHDPLAEFPDLQAEVSNGDVTRARALEIAQARAEKKASETRQQQEQQTTQQRQQQEQVIAQARQSLNALEAELKAADPHYAAKREALVAKVQEIRQQFPPAQWAAAAKLAYQTIPNPAPKPTPGPMRPAGHRPAVVPAVFENPEDALDAGIAAASAA